jgi:hypothetical protein
MRIPEESSCVSVWQLPMGSPDAFEQGSFRRGRPLSFGRPNVTAWPDRSPRRRPSVTRTGRHSRGSGRFGESLIEIDAIQEPAFLSSSQCGKGIEIKGLASVKPFFFGRHGHGFGHGQLTSAPPPADHRPYSEIPIPRINRFTASCGYAHDAAKRIFRVA